MARSNDSGIINIAPVEIITTSIRIAGTTPLIVHAWSEKAKREMLDKQTGKTKTKAKEAKNIWHDFIESAYWMAGKPTEYTQEAFEAAIHTGVCRWGFPVTAIKQAAASAAIRNDIGIPMTKIRGAFFIEGEGENLLAEIKGSVPSMREDMVRVGGISKTADIRHRAQFDNWYMDLMIRYNKNGPISIEQIINLINLGGFSCGIGEWRPEKDGDFGMFQVVEMS